MYIGREEDRPGLLQKKAGKIEKKVVPKSLALIHLLTVFFADFKGTQAA